MKPPGFYYPATEPPNYPLWKDRSVDNNPTHDDRWRNTTKVGPWIVSSVYLGNEAWRRREFFETMVFHNDIGLEYDRIPTDNMRDCKNHHQELVTKWANRRPEHFEPKYLH